MTFREFLESKEFYICKWDYDSYGYSLQEIPEEEADELEQEYWKQELA